MYDDGQNKLLKHIDPTLHPVLRDRPSENTSRHTQGVQDGDLLSLKMKKFRIVEFRKVQKHVQSTNLPQRCLPDEVSGRFWRDLSTALILSLIFNLAHSLLRSYIGSATFFRHPIHPQY